MPIIECINLLIINEHSTVYIYWQIYKIIHITHKKLSLYFKHVYNSNSTFLKLLKSFCEEYILENKFWSHEKSLEDSKCREAEGVKIFYLELDMFSIFQEGFRQISLTFHLFYK